MDIDPGLLELILLADVQGGTLEFRPGVYRFTKTIMLRNLNLRGAR